MTASYPDAALAPLRPPQRTRANRGCLSAPSAYGTVNATAVSQDGGSRHGGSGGNAHEADDKTTAKATAVPPGHRADAIHLLQHHAVATLVWRAAAPAGQYGAGDKRSVLASVSRDRSEIDGAWWGERVGDSDGGGGSEGGNEDAGEGQGRRGGAYLVVQTYFRNHPTTVYAGTVSAWRRRIRRAANLLSDFRTKGGTAV